MRATIRDQWFQNLSVTNKLVAGSLATTSINTDTIKVCGSVLINSTGIQGAIGADGLSITGAQGIQGVIGPDGISITGPQGLIGEIGADGIQGLVGPQGLTVVGPQGIIGEIGPQGIQGVVGPQGLAGVISSAMYVQLGAQPGSIAANEPFTFTTTVLSTAGITATTAIFSPPFTASGTVFQLDGIGRYEVNYQVYYPTNGGVVLYFGSTVAGMLALPYSMIGKPADGAVFGSVIIESTTSTSFLAMCAGANSVAIQPGPNSSSTNQNATTISIKKIS